MGTWGAENFANAGARDYLALLAAKLMATINEIFIDDERLALDEDGESMFMPSVELLALLCERYFIVPPRPNMVRQWHERYLERYDATIDQLMPENDFKVERRQVIEKTFRWLEGLSATYWES